MPSRNRRGHEGAERQRAGAGRMVENFDGFFHSFAAQSRSLRVGRRGFRVRFRRARAGLELQSTFVPTQEFATDILPGVRETPATTKALIPWIDQVEASLSPSELGGVGATWKSRRPDVCAAPEAYRFRSSSRPNSFNRCLTHAIFPAGKPAPGRGRDDRRGGLQGILVRPRRPRRHRTGLHRQRPDQPLPGVDRRDTVRSSAADGIAVGYETDTGLEAPRTRVAEAARH